MALHRQAANAQHCDHATGITIRHTYTTQQRLEGLTRSPMGVPRGRLDAFFDLLCHEHLEKGG